MKKFFLAFQGFILKIGNSIRGVKGFVRKFKVYFSRDLYKIV